MVTLEALQDKSEHELRNILSERNAREEEVRRLNRALHNLKKYTGTHYYYFTMCTYMFLFLFSMKNEIFGIIMSISMYMCMFPPSFQLLLHKYMFLEFAIISFIGTMFQGNRHYCLNSLSLFM